MCHAIRYRQVIKRYLDYQVIFVSLQKFFASSTRCPYSSGGLRESTVRSRKPKNNELKNQELLHNLIIKACKRKPSMKLTIREALTRTSKHSTTNPTKEYNKHNHTNPKWLFQRAILASKNNIVYDINFNIRKKIPGEERICESTDAVVNLKKVLTSLQNF